MARARKVDEVKATSSAIDADNVDTTLEIAGTLQQMRIRLARVLQALVEAKSLELLSQKGTSRRSWASEVTSGSS